jgi:Arc/MetJ-type ribon-helix-helix transcriptional regulator
MNEHARTTITLSLTPEDVERLDLAVREGGYASREEVVMLGVDTAEGNVMFDDMQVDHLRRIYKDGLESGLAEPFTTEDFLAELKREKADDNR